MMDVGTVDYQCQWDIYHVNCNKCPAAAECHIGEKNEEEDK